MNLKCIYNKVAKFYGPIVILEVLIHSSINNMPIHLHFITSILAMS